MKNFKFQISNFKFWKGRSPGPCEALAPKTPKADRFALVRGQVMLLTSMILSASVVTAIAIAGFLNANQVKQVKSSANSTQAILAADTGLEFGLFRVFKEDDGACNYESPTITGADFEMSITLNSYKEMVIDSIGDAGGSTRAFQVNLGELSIHLPCSEE